MIDNISISNHRHMTYFINNFLPRLTINILFIKFINRNRKLGLKKNLSSNCISGGVGFEYQFFVKDMRLGFTTNLLTLGNSKIGLSKLLDFSKSETKDQESMSKSLEEEISFPFLEIARAVLVEVLFCLVFIFCKSKSICSTFFIVLV